MASFIAAGTAYATAASRSCRSTRSTRCSASSGSATSSGRPPTQRTRGFLLGATAGRTTLLGEGLQHQDGHSLVLASTVPACQAYDPAFAYEVATIVQHGLQRMYGDNGPDAESRRLLLPHPLQRELSDAADAGARTAERRDRAGCTGGGTHRRVPSPRPRCCSPARRKAPPEAAEELAAHYDVGVELWSATSYKALRDEALASSAGTASTRARATRAARRRLLGGADDARSSPSPTS